MQIPLGVPEEEDERGQAQEPKTADDPLGREQAHYSSVPEQSAAGYLGGIVGWAGAPRRADDIAAAPQTTPRLPGGRVHAQSVPQLRFDGGERLVATSTAGA